MSTQGTLHFRATLDTEGLKKGIQETNERLKRGASETTQALRQAQREQAGATRQNIDIQRRVIRQMQDEYKKLQKTIEATAPGAEQSALIRQAETLKGHIRDEQEAMARLTQEVAQTERVHTSLRTQLKELKDEMARLRAEGIDEQSEAYKRLAGELGRLQDIQGDIQRQGAILSDDDAQLKGLLSGLQGVAGGFGAVTGAMVLFGEENEEVQRSMQKLMATMQVVQGIQAVSEALNKDSAFSLVTLRGLREAYNRANARGAVVATTATTAQTAQTGATIADTTATGIQTGAKITLIGVLRTLWATMLSNPITAVMAGVGALAVAIYKLTERGREAERQQQALKEAIIETASEPVGKFLALSNEFERLSGKIAEQEAFVLRHAEAFRQLGLEIGNATDAERVFVQQKDAFIQAQIAKAKANALVGSEQYKEQLKALIEAEQKVQEVRARQEQHKQTAQRYGGKANEHYLKELEQGIATELRQAQKARETLAKIQEQALRAEQEASEQMERINGTRGEQMLRQAQEQYQKVIDAKLSFDERYAKEREQILKRYSGREQDERALAERDRELEALGINYERERLELASRQKHSPVSKTRQETDRERALRQAEEAEQRATEAVRKQLQEAQEAHKAYWRSKLTATERHLEAMAELNERYNRAESERERERIDILRQAEVQRYQTETLKAGDSEAKRQAEDLEKLLSQYRSYEERINDLTQEYETKRALLRKAGRTEALKALDKEEARRKSRLAFEELQQGGSYEKLFGNLKAVTTKELQALIKQIEEAPVQLGVELAPEDLERLKQGLQKAKDEIAERNPFEALRQALQDVAGAKDPAERLVAMERATAIASKTFKALGGVVREAMGLLSGFGLSVESETAHALEALGRFADGVIDVMQGIASKNPMQVIAGGLRAIKSVVDYVVGSHDRKMERQIKRQEQQVKRLEMAYKELGQAMQRALGSDYFRGAERQMKNLYSQQQHLYAMQRAEREKKKGDGGKIDGYERQIRELELQRRELVSKLKDELLATDARSAAGELGNAFIDAFLKGENAVDAFSQKVDQMIAGIMRKLIIRNLFEQPIGKVLEKYTNRWVSKDGIFAGTDKVARDMDDMSRELKQVTEGIRYYMTDHLFEKLGAFDASGKLGGNSLSAEVKGVTEQTAKLLEGQINAIRLTSEKAGATYELIGGDIRQMVGLLGAIKQDTAQLRHLESIDARLETIERSGAGVRSGGEDPTEAILRAKGLG